MWKTIVPAAAVLAAEAVIRRKINVRRSARGGGGRVRLPPGRHGAADRHGPDARRRAGQSHRALGARVGHGLCVPAAGGHPVFPAHHLERG